eukprot:gene1695-4819_t
MVKSSTEKREKHFHVIIKEEFVLGSRHPNKAKVRQVDSEAVLPVIKMKRSAALQQYDFLQDFRLHYGEHVIKHFHVRTEGQDGFFVVTNKRFAWQKIGSLYPNINISARDLKQRPSKISSNQSMRMKASLRIVMSYCILDIELTEAAALRDEAMQLVVKIFNSASSQTVEQDTLHSAIAEDQSKESLQVVEQKLHEAQQQRAQALKHKKAALLERNPLLKEFFIYAAKKKKVMEESTFWETFKEELGRTSKAASHEKGQHVGISSGLLSNFVRLESSDGQQTEIQLTTTVIDGIFKLYPMVHEAYKRLVLQQKMPESLFWRKVWFSPIFQRGEMQKHSVQVDHLFSDLQDRQESILGNPLNDLSSNEWLHDPEDDTGHVVMKELRSSRHAVLKRRRRNVALLNDDSTKILTLMGTTNSKTLKRTADEREKGNDESDQLRKILKDSINLEDLHSEKEVPADTDLDLIAFRERYRYDPSSGEKKQAETRHFDFSAHCRPLSLNSDTAMDVAKQFLMNSASRIPDVEQHVQERIYNYEEVFQVMLRQFWSSAGIHSSHDEAKAGTLAQLLDKYRRKRLEQFERELDHNGKFLLKTLHARVDCALFHATSK